MDEFDRKILASLQRDSASSRAELAEKAGLSESQVARRRQALEQSRVIRRYRADLDARALGLAVTAFVHVQLKGEDCYLRLSAVLISASLSVCWMTTPYQPSPS